MALLETLIASALVLIAPVAVFALFRRRSRAPHQEPLWITGEGRE